MARRRNIVRLALPLAGVLLFAVFLGSGGASGALVQVNGLQLKADGGFRPQRLPAKHYAPIEFRGHVDLRSLRGGPPPELTEATLEFDHDGRINTRGLATCPAERIATLGSASARRVCKSAEVGTGTVGLLLVIPGGGTVPANTPLTLFNAPPIEGNVVVNAHVHLPSPINQTFVVPVVIERTHGEYAYRAKFNIPALTAEGILVHVDAKVGRRFKYKGKLRSFVSARCSDHVLQTHGDFVFADGTVIDGEIQRACVPYGF